MRRRCWGLKRVISHFDLGVCGQLTGLPSVSQQGSTPEALASGALSSPPRKSGMRQVEGFLRVPSSFTVHPCLHSQYLWSSSEERCSTSSRHESRSTVASELRNLSRLNPTLPSAGEFSSVHSRRHERKCLKLWLQHGGTLRLNAAKQPLGVLSLVSVLPNQNIQCSG